MKYRSYIIVYLNKESNEIRTHWFQRLDESSGVDFYNWYIKHSGVDKQWSILLDQWGMILRQDGKFPVQLPINIGASNYLAQADAATSAAALQLLNDIQQNTAKMQEMIDMLNKLEKSNKC